MGDFEGARVYDLFPERVVASCIQRDVTQSEIDFAVGMIGARGINVLDADPMKDLRDFVCEEIDKYTRNIIAPRNEINLRLTMSWSFDGQEGSICRRRNSFMSGVLFLNANKDDGSNIAFFKSHDAGHLYIPTYSPQSYNMELCEIGVDEGYLFLFPSRFAHQVKASGTCIAFNTFPTGWIGDAGEPDSFWI